MSVRHVEEQCSLGCENASEGDGANLWKQALALLAWYTCISGLRQAHRLAAESPVSMGYRQGAFMAKTIYAFGGRCFAKAARVWKSRFRRKKIGPPALPVAFVTQFCPIAHRTTKREQLGIAQSIAPNYE